MGRQLTIAVAVLVLFVMFYEVPGRKFWAMPVGGGGAVGNQDLSVPMRCDIIPKLLLLPEVEPSTP